MTKILYILTFFYFEAVPVVSSDTAMIGIVGKTWGLEARHLSGCTRNR